MSHWFRDYIFIPLGGSRKGKVPFFSDQHPDYVFKWIVARCIQQFVIWGLGNGFNGWSQTSLTLSQRFRNFGTGNLQMFPIIICAVGTHFV